MYNAIVYMYTCFFFIYKSLEIQIIDFSARVTLKFDG